MSGEDSLSRRYYGAPGRLQAGAMRTRILTIIAVGITLGFLLGMAVVALLRAMVDGTDTGLEVAFTLLVAFMGAMLISYVVRTTQA